MSHYLFRRFFKLPEHRKLPSLKNTLTTEFSQNRLDPDIELVLLMGLVRNPAEAIKLMERYQVQTAADLFHALPPRPRFANVKNRVHRWLISIEGSYLSDPHKQEFKPR